MPSPVSTPDVYPPLTADGLLSFQFSSWYPKFSSLSIKSTIIRPLSKDFLDYLDADGVFMPEGADDQFVSSPLPVHRPLTTHTACQRVHCPMKKTGAAMRAIPRTKSTARSRSRSWMPRYATRSRGTAPSSRS